jgi:phage repressor protein C with HTH and peptisase S24 domain
MEYLMFEKTVNLLSEYVEVVTDLRKETGGLWYRGVNPNDTFIMLTKGDSIDPTIKVISDYKDYDTEEINPEQLTGTDLKIIGRVVWSGQRM